MTTPTAPFVRQFGPGAEGPDVRAVKRALIAAGKGFGVAITDTFGKAAQAELIAFKTMCKLDPNPIYTSQAHHYLAPYFDATGVELLEDEEKILARAAFVAVAAATVAHVALWDYSETIGDGPGERGWWRTMPNATDWTDTTRRSSDCGQHWIGCGHHAGLANPIFTTDAATGEILELPTVTAATAKPGDGVVFKGPEAAAGHHITTLYKLLANGDWQVVNMGAQGEPKFDLLSNEISYQASQGFSELVYVGLPL